MGAPLKTAGGYMFLEVASALQKAIRRADGRLAGYWAMELYDSGYPGYLWRRLLIISAEDCWGCITFEIDALYRAWETLQPHDRKRKDGRGAGRLFAAKAAILLAMARKCRDADNLICLAYEQKQIDEKKLERDLAAARANPEPIPGYAFDCHTQKGRRAGRTKDEFYRDEFKALTPREPGLFDELVNKPRKS